MRLNLEWLVTIGGALASILGVIWLIWGPKDHPAVFTTSLAVGAFLFGLAVGLRLKRRSAVTAPPPAPGIRILKDNYAMAKAVEKIVTDKNNKISKVTVIQYSGYNITNTLKHLSRTGAEVEVYFVEPARAKEVNPHQEDRAVKGPANVDNCLLADPIAKLRKFRYDAPGSIRAVWIHGHALFMGAYQYEVADLQDLQDPTKHRQWLDTRGDEVPLFEVPESYEDFQHFRVAIDKMINNWKAKADERTAKPPAKQLP